MQKLLTFKEFIYESSDATMTKNRANSDGRETNDKFNDITTDTVLIVKEKLESCVEILDSIYKKLKETNITTKPIESSLAELKSYLASIEKTSQTLLKSNTLKT
jgi:hypothetical protein